MNKEGNTYTFIFATVMVIVVAAILAFLATQLQPYQQRNEELEKMQSILASIKVKSTPETAEEKFKKYITNSFVVNTKGEKIENVDAFNVKLAVELKKSLEDRNLPVFVGKKESGKKIIVPVRGKGLWGPIWGYIAFNDDYNTIYGATFGHKGETPGLGAEINTQSFQEQFYNKTIFDAKGSLVAVQVVKGEVPEDAPHQVDAISGGTITSKGLEEMLKTNLKAYKAYFEQQKNQ